MRLLFVTDMHLSNQKPVNRTDDFKTTLLSKLYEVGQIAKAYGVSYIINGGDIFDRPKCETEYLNSVIRILKDYPVPMYVVPGNHDIFGYNINTINRTSLDTLFATGICKRLDRQNPLKIVLSNNKVIQIEGQEYKIDIDNGSTNDVTIHYPGDFNILVSHSMIIDHNYVTDHTLIQNINTNANLVLSGHLHEGFKECFVNNTMYINPGAMTRRDAGRKDIPKVLIIDINEETLMYSYAYVFLKNALPREQVFNLKTQNQITNTKLISTFKQQLKTIDPNKSIDVINVLRQSSVELKLKEEIFNKSMQYISAAQQNVDVFDATVKGFIPKNSVNHIKSVTIKNRHTYINQKIDFGNGLNVILGETGAGKSNILRAIQWVLYNYPKGNNFIRTGEKSCSVSVEFEDGTIITRKRSKTGTGSYILEVNGNKQEFKGFGNEIPLEIINAHQMPSIQLAKGYDVKINSMAQADLEFLIRQSPAVIAYCIGNVIPGTQVINVANKQALADNRNLSINISELQKQQQKDISELSKYDGVNNFIQLKDNIKNQFNEICNLNNYINNLTTLANDRKNCINSINYTFNNINNLSYIESVENIINKYNEQLSRLQILISLYNQIHEAKSNINIINNSLSAIDNIISSVENIDGYDKLEQIISNVNDKIIMLNDYNDTKTKEVNVNNYIANLDKQIDVIEENIKICSTIDSINEMINLLNDFVNTNNDITYIENKLSSIDKFIDVAGIDLEVDKLEKMINILIEYRDTYANINDIDSSITNINNEIDSLNKSLLNNEEEKKKFLESNNVCPVCGGKLNYESLS